MSTVYTDITLKNAGDLVRVQDVHIKEKDVRRVTVNALVDTGAGTLVITESVRQKLGLEIKGSRSASLANNEKVFCKVTEPVDISWKNRETSCRALVVPGEGDVLLGAIPLEDMDLVVYPAKQELRGAHGDEVVCLLR
ncbi:MAG: clan AA aspartic protease [Spirochaetaceae bacterium]|nr:clan AA aspartic protease [Spirochaetaceae bacterium]